MDDAKKNLIRKKTFLIGIFLAFLSLYFLASSKQNQINFEELAINKDASIEFGKVENYRIHCQDLRDINDCLSSYFRFGENLPVILWLGNSQLHAINQFKIGDKPSSVKLHKRLKKKGYFLITFSQPNANLQEHLILTAHLMQKIPIKKIILPVVFDDMRVVDIRLQIENIFKDEKTKKFLIKNSQIGSKLYQNFLNKKKKTFQSHKKKKSLQESSEKFLNEKLKKAWYLWSERPSLRGELLNNFYQLRNFIFNINPSSTRNMIPGYYLKNFEAIKDLIKISKINQIETLVYIAPIRNDYKIPYKISEYEKFKSDIKNQLKLNKIHFRNFENIIPNIYWGTKKSTSILKGQEIDFMHFRSEGHNLLAEVLYEEIIKIIDK